MSSATGPTNYGGVCVSLLAGGLLQVMDGIWDLGRGVVWRWTRVPSESWQCHYRPSLRLESMSPNDGRTHQTDGEDQTTDDEKKGNETWSVRSWVLSSDHSSSGISVPAFASTPGPGSTANARVASGPCGSSRCAAHPEPKIPHRQPAAGLPYKRLGASLCCGSGKFQGESSGRWRGIPMQTKLKDNQPGGRGRHHLSFHDENNLFPRPKHKKPCNSSHLAALIPLCCDFHTHRWSGLVAPFRSARDLPSRNATQHGHRGPGARPSLCLRTRTVPPRRTCPDKATYQRHPQPSPSPLCVVSRRCCGEAQHQPRARCGELRHG